MDYNGGGMARILIVERDPFVARTLRRLLERDGHRVDVAREGHPARAALEQDDPDLLLCDWDATDGDGLPLLERAASHHRCATVLMADPWESDVIDVRSSNLALSGYLTRPIPPAQLRITVDTALRLRAHAPRGDGGAPSSGDAAGPASSPAEVPRLIKAGEEARRSHEETILRLSRAAEFRDDETGQHVRRMSHYCALVARRCGMGEDHAEQLRIASPLHDVGKIGIPDQILFKPGRLSRDEFDHMKRHTVIGHRILAGSSSDLLQLASVVALTHHENIDGSGYPRGLRGEEIPLDGRVCAVADVFDALTSRRVYKEAMSVDEALEIMRAERGTKFDPEVFDAFTDSMDEVLAIRTRYADDTPRDPGGGEAGG